MPRVADLPTSPIPGLRQVDLLAGGEQALQAFFEANPLYFLTVNGEAARANEANEEIHEPLPAGYTFTHKYVFGYEGSDGQLVAMANVISDLFAEGVWHIGTFIVANAMHGTGVAQTLYSSIEDWAKKSGASWLRLGVVEGNPRAEAFWARCGYSQVAKREGMVMGRKTNTVRVMAKPLHGQGITEYYQLVARDRPATNAA